MGPNVTRVNPIKIITFAEYPPIITDDEVSNTVYEKNKGNDYIIKGVESNGSDSNDNDHNSGRDKLVKPVCSIHDSG